jgi:hypothetical protein
LVYVMMARAMLGHIILRLRCFASEQA